MTKSGNIQVPIVLWEYLMMIQKTCQGATRFMISFFSFLFFFSFLRKRHKALYYLKRALTRTSLQKEIKHKSLKSSAPSSFCIPTAHSEQSSMPHHQNIHELIKGTRNCNNWNMKDTAMDPSCLKRMHSIKRSGF